MVSQRNSERRACANIASRSMTASPLQVNKRPRSLEEAREGKEGANKPRTTLGQIRSNGSDGVAARLQTQELILQSKTKKKSIGWETAQ